MVTKKEGVEEEKMEEMEEKMEEKQMEKDEEVEEEGERLSQARKGTIPGGVQPSSQDSGG